VARAKRTDRSEARRRYRAYLQEQADKEEAAAEAADEPQSQATSEPSKPARQAQAKPVAPPPGQRVGFGAALRKATRPVHYRDDLRYAPQLILHTNAIWVPALISVGFLAYGLTRSDYNDSGISLMLSIAYPPIIQAVISGFLSPRASWLAGLFSGAIGGLAAGVIYTYVLSGRLDHTPADKILRAGDIPIDVFQLVLNSMVISVALAAGSAWYKRFLSTMGPARPAQPRGSQKPQSRRAAASRPRR
jgi:hypothetical protein